MAGAAVSCAAASCAAASDAAASGAVASGAFVIGLVAGSHCAPDHADRLRAIGVHAIARDFNEVAALLG